MSKPRKRWEFMGGGTLLMGKLKYPSDATYENRDTGAKVSLVCTVSAYLKLPTFVRKPSDLARRAGVKHVRALGAE